MSEQTTIAQQILAAPDRAGTPVQAWGLSLLIVPMSGTDRDSYDAELWAAKKEGRELDHWRVRFLVRCLCDEAGNRLFTDQQYSDLGKKDHRVLARLFRLAEEVNATGDGAVEQAAKNS